MDFNSCFWKSYHHILMHFVPQFQCFGMFLKLFSKTVFFLKNLWVSICFDWLSLFFYQSKLVLKFLVSLYLFQLIEPSTSINRKSYGKFFKNWFSIETNTFSKSSLPFLSPYDSVKAQSQIFFRFRPFFLQGFPLPRPVRPLYPSLCFYFHVFMHKLMHFVGIFGPFQIWDFCWIKLLFLKLIIGFCSYIVIIMLYDG